MSNQAQDSKNRRKFDLYERTSIFGEKIILFAKEIPILSFNYPLINQLIRASTSIGANYMEADCAESKKDFKHKMGICRKESKETTHWLRMIAAANPLLKEKPRILWKEAHELTLIFSAINKKK